MTYSTEFTIAQIDELTSILAGDQMGKSRNKEKAIARLVQYCLNCNLEPIHCFGGSTFKDVKEWCEKEAARMDAEEATVEPSPAVKKAVAKQMKAKEPMQAAALSSAETTKKGEVEEVPAEIQKRTRVSVKDIEHPALLSDREMMNAAQRLEPGRYAITKSGADYLVTAHKTDECSYWHCLIEYRDDKFEGAAKSYKAAVRRAMLNMAS